MCESPTGNRKLRKRNFNKKLRKSDVKQSNQHQQRAAHAKHVPSATAQPQKFSSPPGNPENATPRQQLRNPNAKQKQFYARAPKKL
jgi:hypothetical protein